MSSDTVTRPSAWIEASQRVADRRTGTITAPQMVASMKQGVLIERLELIRIVNGLPNNLDGPATKRRVIDEILARNVESKQ